MRGFGLFLGWMRRSRRRVGGGGPPPEVPVNAWLDSAGNPWRTPDGIDFYLE